MLALPCNFRRVLENTGPNSLSLSLSLLFSYVAPCILPLPSPLSTFLSPPFILGHRRILSRGGDGTYTLSLSPHFRQWDTRANLYLLFRWNLRHTAIRRIFWSNCSPREKRSFVKYASHSSDCNRRMRNACESTPFPDSPVYWMKRRNSTVPFPSSFDFSDQFVRGNGGRSLSWN